MSNNIWKDSNHLYLLSQTVQNLRRMRTACVSSGLTFSQKLNKNINNFAGGNQREISPKQAYQDAQELANLMSSISSKGVIMGEMDDKLIRDIEIFLQDSTKDYGLYEEGTFSGAGMQNVIFRSMKGRMKCLTYDPEHFLTWELTINNNLGNNKSLTDALSKEMPSVVAPLSGDYLLALIYSKYLEQTRGKSFEIAPIMLSSDLETYYYPKDNLEKLPYLNKRKIGVYTDTKDSGSTIERLDEILRQVYKETQCEILESPFDPEVYQAREKVMKIFQIIIILQQ
ncbi:MAG: hypothetical protein LAT82_00610 [Nanoarchaeota archaeon]|nr:hypothetical protein [Nanoarchaeota archaeon]